jgi:hypothetical protein
MTMPLQPLTTKILTFTLQFIAGTETEEKNMAPVHLPLCIVEDVKPAVKSKAYILKRICNL